MVNGVPTLNASDLHNLPQCFDGKFIRLVGIYRVAFENSDLYDPTKLGASAWVSFGPFYRTTKRCGIENALDVIHEKAGGTCGFVATGVIRTGRGYGHLGGWPHELQVICIEKIVRLADFGWNLASQDPRTRELIIDWYVKERRQ